MEKEIPSSSSSSQGAEADGVAANHMNAQEPIVGTWSWGSVGSPKRETLVFHQDGRITPDNGGKHWWEKEESFRGHPTYRKRFDNGKSASSILVYIDKDNKKLIELHAGASYEIARRVE